MRTVPRLSMDVDVLHRDLLLPFAAVAIERIEQSRIGAGELVRRLGKFAELRGLSPVVGSHAMARTHMISNQHTSPIALAKSTAIGRKAMTYRNGFMRIDTLARRHNHRPMWKGQPATASVAPSSKSSAPPAERTPPVRVALVSAYADTPSLCSPHDREVMQ
jgi:hypothetical protein